MRKKGFFITGTDTGIGKTWATLYLMNVLRNRGLKVVAMKPVATGAISSEGRWVNEDALALQRAASIPVPYEQVNPFVFESPASPHIAAAQAGRRIDLGKITRIFSGLAESADGVLVEGVGGWKVPLNGREQVADLAGALGVPVILVVGLRLGCLNHALLTHAAIASSGVAFAGWIANRIVRDFPYAAENIETLTAELGGPPLAVLPYCEEPRRFVPEMFSESGPDEILRVLGS
jgi:dethiobiotin synthetase